MKTTLRLALPLLLLGLLIPSQSNAQQRVEVSRDLWISAYHKETEGNNGGSPKLKLKGIQEFFLIDFDPAPFRGRLIQKAQLHVRLTSADHPLQRTTVSSIAEDWVEGTGTGYQRQTGSSSFHWARTGEKRWGFHQPDITSVLFGEGGSVWAFGDVTPPDPKGWQIIPIAPEVVQARIEGRSFGFAALDDVGSEYQRTDDTVTFSLSVNRFFSSREDRKEARPFFTLWFDESRSTAPQPSTQSPSGPLHEPNPTAAPILLPTELPNPSSPTPTAALPPLPFECADEFGTPLKDLQFFGARGETLGFSVSAPPDAVQLNLPGAQIQRFTMPKAGNGFDPLVPIDRDSKPCPLDLAGARTFIEIHLPKSLPPGPIHGHLSVSGKTAPLHLTVWNFALPDHLSFIVQMNAYSLPSSARDYYRIAHEHRTTLNVLPYHWNGKIDEPAPVIGKDGAWNWSAFDTIFGPLLDGSAFADLPRAGVPVEAFYLMLNENWPMVHDTHFRGGYWIETAFEDAYWKQFHNAAARIAAHLHEKGWSQTTFEFYLNNKAYFKKNDWKKCSAAWVFDEPVHTQDFWALRRYGMEFWNAVRPWPKLRLAFRVDISRPQWQRDLLDHCANEEVVSGALRTYWPRVHRRATAGGSTVLMYGSANPIEISPAANAAWCVEAWSLGADGVLPWSTIGNEASWQNPTETSLFYPTPKGPVPSVRLKTFRSGQQLVEYLTQFTALSGHPRTEIMAALRAMPGFAAVSVKRSEEDAGRSQFPEITGEAFQKLRLQLGHWLDGRSPAARKIWHSPHPKRPDPSLARPIVPLPIPGTP